MELRPAVPADLPGVVEIDATIESLRYLHVDRSGEGLNVVYKIEDRPLRERLIAQYPMDDERQFAFKQLTKGVEDGLAVVAIHDDGVVGSILAQPRPSVGVLEVLDLRVDFDHRREGLGLAMMYQAMNLARDAELRAVLIQSSANNYPLAELLTKLEFELTGLDTHRLSNHDLVKEAVTLSWYAVLR